MTSCPECENDLDIDVEEAEEGDVVACSECGTEYEIVGVEPLELFVDGGLFQGAVKDVHRLVATSHDTSLWSWATRRRCGAE